MSVVVEDPLVGYSAGGYRIERLLGAGGMGLVYQARHERIDRRFAVKVLRPEVADDAELARNFVREAQTLSALKHPNIIDIVGFGPLPDGREYMVMEFLEGHTLEEEMSKGALPLERALFLAEQVLNALAAAHSVDVIHRDLKPSNVFLAIGSGGVETVKLLDFGLAKQQPVALTNLAAERTQPEAGKSAVAGTPEYVAPEQALGQGASPKSDLYSFGVMFFEMLAGRLPFNPGAEVIDRISALLRAHLYEEAPELHAVGLKVPDALSRLLKELLAKRPEERPVSAASVRDRVADLRQLFRKPSVEALPVVPLPLTTPVDDMRALRPSRARPAVLIPLLLVVLLLLGLALWFVTPATPAPVAVTAPAPAVVTPAPSPSTDELEALRRLEAAQQKPTTPPPVEPPPAPPVVVTRKPTTVMALSKSDCEPDDRWRSAARRHVQELQQLAASHDGAHWSEFESLEPQLSAAIDGATTGAQCDAVEQQIRRLAIAWKK